MTEAFALALNQRPIGVPFLDELSLDRSVTQLSNSDRTCLACNWLPTQLRIKPLLRKRSGRGAIAVFFMDPPVLEKFTSATLWEP